ncbi:unnamed protein product, partial [Closterium sp. NIES-53]
NPRQPCALPPSSHPPIPPHHCQPHVDFALRVLGLDIMAIPGLCNLAQNLISDAIADLYLWPKTIELYHEEPKLAVGWLTISAMRASNLRNLGLVGTSDPYLHFYLTSSLGSRESSVRDNDLNPDWGDEELRLKVLDPATQKLHVEVFDKNTGKADRLMGVQLVALSELAVGEAKDFELRLAPRFSDLGGAQSGGRSRRDIGSVCFRLLYKHISRHGTWWMARGGWHVVDGTWWMARAGWHVLDGMCWMARGGWHVLDGTCWMARAGWHVVDGTCWMARGGWHVVDGMSVARVPDTNNSVGASPSPHSFLSLVVPFSSALWGRTRRHHQWTWRRCRRWRRRRRRGGRGLTIPSVPLPALIPTSPLGENEAPPPMDVEKMQEEEAEEAEK